MNIHTGETTKLKKISSYGEIFTNPDGSFYSVTGDNIIKYDTVEIERINFQEILDDYFEPATYYDFSFYKDRFIYIGDTEKNSVLASFSNSGSTDVKYIELEDSLFVYQDDISWRIKGIDREKSGFYKIQNCYIPLVITKKENGKKFTRLNILDLDSVQFLWKSKYLLNSFWDRYIDEIFYHQGYYTLVLTTDDKTDNKNEWLISISSETGMFHKAIQFQSDNYYNHPIQWKCYEMFADDYIYGTENDQIWCLTYPDLELVYTNNPELKVIDAKAEIEELFGRMEWE